MLISLKDVAGTELLVGSDLGNVVYGRLYKLASGLAPSETMKISFADATFIDATFIREAVNNLIKIVSPARSICIVHVQDRDQEENLQYVANAEAPMTAWLENGRCKIFGESLSNGLQAMLEQVAYHGALTTPAAATFTAQSVQNASTTLKRLYDMGYIARTGNKGETGGIEYTYHAVGYDVQAGVGAS
jgi:hypothetical protein